jgi:hypothetical protein
MRRLWCEREADVVRSLRTGTLPAELRDHVVNCVVCAEARTASGIMLRAASQLRVEDELPAAGVVWSRAQALRREIGLKRAARPLMVMKVLSIVYGVVCAGWALRFVWRFLSLELSSGWGGFWNVTAGSGAVIVLLAIAMGTWFLLADGRRSDADIPSST